MKRVLFVLFAILLLYGCQREEVEPVVRMVKVDGVVYEESGKGRVVARCGVMDGEITDVVSSDAIPKKDNQSNFGRGYGYQYAGENTIEVYIGEEWIQFTAKDPAQ